MLTHSHLAVIRAALQFWDEEMSPHDPAIGTAYFDEPIGTGGWIKPAVQWLRAQLPLCRLRYLAYSPDGSDVLGDELFETLEEAQAALPEDAAVIATILIFEASD